MPIRTRSSFLLRGRPGTAAVAAIGMVAVLSAAAGLSAAPEPPATGAAPAGSAPAPAAFTPAGLEFFEKKVRPLLAEQCLGCHNAKLKAPQGALKLDSRAAMLLGGNRGSILTPGNPEQSLLIQAVDGSDAKLQMPPKGKLSAEQVKVLTEWVQMGAPWPGADPKAGPIAKGFNLQGRAAAHWAWKAPVRPAVPAVKNKAWVRTPIDAFILAKLEAKGLAPAGPADRRTLIRRVTYDLIGLPPTPEEVEAFVKDPAPNAYDKVVERLLASPHYGERWGRHWLDLVRFAETDGHEFDFEKPGAFEYRDYVTRALNADVPYDQFVREHIAGDLLPKPRFNSEAGRNTGINESIIATGFWHFGEGKHSPVDLREDESERTDNQIDVFSKTFLGMSVGCAKCHDHKFDAISTKDYYALFGILKSSRQDRADVRNPEQLRKTVAALTELDAKLQPQLLAKEATARQAQAGKLAAYLLAARDVMQVSSGAPAMAAGDVLFEDFEKPTYEGWTATGTAFGIGPNRQPIPAYQGDINHLGKGFINTHSAVTNGERMVGDRSVGTLTSRAFKIEKPYIRFLVGGGGHEGQTCVNLLVDGKVVRTVTGKYDNRMDWTHWDVRNLSGKEGRIEVVDRFTGGWGQIGLDHILFTQQPLAGMDLEQAAAKHGVDAAALAGWVKYLKETAARDADDPFHPWALLAGRPAGAFADGKAELARSYRGRTEQAKQDRAAATVFADFGKQGYDGWYVTGEAFGTGPTRSAALRVNPAAASDPSAAIEGVLPAGSADSGRLSPKLEGSLRSPSFVISKAQMHFSMAGKGVTVNLIIDNFQRIRFPIYGGLTFTTDGGNRPRWYSMDVGQWVGHRAYLEFLDYGSGWGSMDQILFTDGRPPVTAPNSAVARLLDDHSVNTAEAMAQGYAELVRETTGLWGAGQLRADARDQVEIVNAMLASPLPGADMTACGPGEQPMQPMLEQRRALEAALPNSRRVLAMADGPGEDEYVHVRGSYRAPGDRVQRRSMEALEGAKQPQVQQGSGRWELAQRLTRADHPLLSRVMVNRVWQHHFGEGLVGTPDDFGVRGDKPTHPELLDYLATSFVAPANSKGGLAWSLKSLHRMMVLSSTYRQSSERKPVVAATKKPAAGAKAVVRDAQALDPQNKLLHRMRVRRLEAEAIRDGMLAVSGRLDPALYGPSVIPYLTGFLEGRGRPDRSGPLDGAGRRSLYISVRRNFLVPMFLAFDYPIPFTTIGRRSVSTVPAQALTLMNNPFVVEQAGLWAKRELAAEAATPEARITRMYERAFARPPQPSELKNAVEFLKAQDQSYGQPDDPRSWTDLCHVLINVKEFIFIK